MKKFVAILLLHVFLFNLIGYKLFFSYLEYRADRKIEARLDIIDDSELITVKIPIGLPYQTDWKDFERVDGEVSFKGTTYRYVKQKVYKDTLILLCLNYQEKSKLKKSNNDYFKKANGMSAEQDKKPVSKTFKCEFCDEQGPVALTSLMSREFRQVYRIIKFSASTGYLLRIESPPEIANC